MRRSRSMTNIPMPYNIKQKRARSTVRTSQEPSIEGQTPLASRCGGNTPLAYRLGSAQKNITPSCSTGYKRSGSVNSFGFRASLTQNNKSPLEKKSLQKLMSDKKWVADQYSKVQSFIQTSGLFKPELSAMLRPPTINTVVELLSVLLRELIRTDPINTQNYADVAFKTLKLLNYPGPLTLSTLKTVNTMHGWPHFISLISWLIERIDLDSIQDAFIEQQDDEVKQMFKLQNSVLEFFTARHSIFVGEVPKDQNMLVNSEHRLFENMAMILEVDIEAVNNLNQPIETCRAEINELNTKIEEINEDILKLQAQNKEKQEIIQNFKESNGSKEEDLEAELTQLRKRHQKDVENKKNLTLSVKQLENVVASQSGRYDEKVKLLSQIEDLNRAIARKERKLAEYRAVRDKLDHELRTMVTEIEAKVDAWNVSVTKTLLSELQHLRLREKGFHSTDFLDELKQTHKKKEEIQKQLQNELSTIQSDIEQLKRKREALVKNNKTLEATKEKLDSLKKSIQKTKEENQSLLSKIEEVKKTYDPAVKKDEYIKRYKIEESQSEIAELDARIQELTEKMTKSAKKGLGIIAEAHKMVAQNLQKIDGVMRSMVEDVTEKAEESARNLQDIYDYLLSIQEMSSNMFQEDKEN